MKVNSFGWKERRNAEKQDYIWPLSIAGIRYCFGFLMALLDTIGNPSVTGVIVGTLSIILIRVLFLKIDDLESIR